MYKKGPILVAALRPETLKAEILEFRPEYECDFSQNHKRLTRALFIVGSHGHGKNARKSYTRSKIFLTLRFANTAHRMAVMGVWKSTRRLMLVSVDDESS